MSARAHVFLRGALTFSVAWFVAEARADDYFLRVPEAPKIPAKTVSIASYGAVGDGKTMNTEAFRKAIEACAKTGGGRVVVPAGTYLTGPIKLESHLMLLLEKGAKIQASAEFADFGVPEPLPATQAEVSALKSKIPQLISGSKLTDVAIAGEGTIDGAGAVWWARSDKASVRPDVAARWPLPKAEGSPAATTGTSAMPSATPTARPFYLPRPHLIALRDCTRVLVKGVTLSNSPMFHFVPARCQELLVEDVKIITPHDAPNTDGIDPSNCSNVLIRRCHIDTGDDNIALKAGAGSGPPCANITVTDCTFGHGHGVSIGSETGAGVHHFLVQKCTFENTVDALRIKSDRTRGGRIEDVIYRDITMKNVTTAINISLFYEDKAEARSPHYQPPTASTPTVSRIRFANITCDGTAKDPIVLAGLPESPGAAIEFENVKITGAAVPMSLHNVKALSLKNVEVATVPAAGPPQPSPSPSLSGSR